MSGPLSADLNVERVRARSRRAPQRVCDAITLQRKHHPGRCLLKEFSDDVRLLATQTIGDLLDARNEPAAAAPAGGQPAFDAASAID